MTQFKYCKSYLHRELTCKDGFHQLPACWNDKSKTLPYCLRDKLPMHFINEDGTPRFYKEKTND